MCVERFGNGGLFDAGIRNAQTHAAAAEGFGALGCGFAALHGIVRGGRGEITAKTDHSHTAVESRLGERGPFGHRECGGGDGDCTGRGVDPQ